MSRTAKRTPTPRPFPQGRRLRLSRAWPRLSRRSRCRAWRARSLAGPRPWLPRAPPRPLSPRAAKAPAAGANPAASAQARHAPCACGTRPSPARPPPMPPSLPRTGPGAAMTRARGAGGPRRLGDRRLPRDRPEPERLNPARAGLGGAGGPAGGRVAHDPLGAGGVALARAGPALASLGSDGLRYVAAELDEPPGDPGPVRARVPDARRYAIAGVADRRRDFVEVCGAGTERAGSRDAAHAVDDAQCMRALARVDSGRRSSPLVRLRPSPRRPVTFGADRRVADGRAAMRPPAVAPMLLSSRGRPQGCRGGAGRLEFRTALGCRTESEPPHRPHNMDYRPFAQRKTQR